MDQESSGEFPIEDRLKAIAYQFVTLYERWSEDRQHSAKQSADLADLIALFEKHMERFGVLDTAVRQALQKSIQLETKEAVKSVSDTISRETARAIEQTVSSLNFAVSDAKDTLKYYKEEAIMTQWKMIGLSMFSGMVVFFLFWLVLRFF